LGELKNLLKDRFTMLVQPAHKFLGSDYGQRAGCHTIRLGRFLTNHDLLREQLRATAGLEEGEFDAGHPQAFESQERRRLANFTGDLLANNDDPLIFVEGHRLVWGELEILPMVLGKTQGLIVEVGLQDPLQFVGVELLGKGCIFERLCWRVTRCPVSFQFHHDDVPKPIQRQQVDGGPEIGTDLTADDEQFAVLHNSVRVLLEPIFEDGFCVLSVKGSPNILLKFAVVIYAEHSHGEASYAE